MQDDEGARLGSVTQIEAGRARFAARALLIGGLLSIRCIAHFEKSVGHTKLNAI